MFLFCSVLYGKVAERQSSSNPQKKYKSSISDANYSLIIDEKHVKKNLRSARYHVKLAYFFPYFIIDFSFPYLLYLQ